MRISFRSENSQTVHIPVKATRTPKHFRILDVTSEVIRDYHQLVPDEESLDCNDGFSNPDDKTLDDGEAAREESGVQPGIQLERPRQHWTGLDMPSSRAETSSPVNRPLSSENYQEDFPRSNILYPPRQVSYDSPEQAGGVNNVTESFTSSNDTWLRRVVHHDQLSVEDNSGYTPPTYSPLSHSVQSGYRNEPIILPEFNTQDGIFLPGSEYLELHSTLRNHLILEAKSSVPTRNTTPDDLGQDLGSLTDQMVARVNISEDEEYSLWKNWLDEIAPWLDKFDNQCHFQNTFLAMARSHSHLRYSILALSARQLERKGATAHNERSLELYHHAIHILLPLLPTRSTAVIASCVVLCVLEMLSCAPKAWRRHLDGCAGLMEAVGINGFSGGPEQALFWCFARMDVCGGLISSSKTLIPVNHWAPGIDIDADVRLFRAATTFDTFANYMVYLCAQVLDIFSTSHHRFGRMGGGRSNSLSDQAFTERWLKLWFYVQDWYLKRPEEMKPVMERASETSSFPKILFANPAAISGNQLYHTAALLMLQAQPPGLRLVPKPQSPLWHARRVCSISINNNHHGAWTNAIQPIWIAGQWMSHSSEHREILELLKRIEQESGWPTKWRADDLIEFWGDSD